MACHVPAVAELPDNEDDPWFCSACADTVRRRDAAVAVLQQHHAACASAGLTPDAVAAAEVSPDEELEVLAALLSGGNPVAAMDEGSPAAVDDEDDVIVMSDSMDTPVAPVTGKGAAKGKGGATVKAEIVKVEDVAAEEDVSPLQAAGGKGQVKDEEMEVCCRADVDTATHVAPSLSCVACLLVWVH